MAIYTQSNGAIVDLLETINEEIIKHPNSLSEILHEMSKQDVLKELVKDIRLLVKGM